MMHSYKYNTMQFFCCLQNHIGSRAYHSELSWRLQMLLSAILHWGIQVYSVWNLTWIGFTTVILTSRYSYLLLSVEDHVYKKAYRILKINSYSELRTRQNPKILQDMLIHLPSNAFHFAATYMLQSTCFGPHANPHGIPQGCPCWTH